MSKSNKNLAFIAMMVLPLIYAIVWHFAFIGYMNNGSRLLWALMFVSVYSGSLISENVDCYFLGKKQSVWTVKKIVTIIAIDVFIFIALFYFANGFVQKSIQNPVIGVAGIQIISFIVEYILFLIGIGAYVFSVNKQEATAEADENC